MAPLNAKQIWDEVFDGQVQTAIEWSRRERGDWVNNRSAACSATEPVVLYLEPSLDSYSGHPLTLASCYIDVFKNQGYQTVVAHSLKSSLQAEASRTPYFLVKHTTMASRNIASAEELEKVQHYFRLEYEEVIRQFSPEVCVLPTIRFTNILAAAQALVSCNIKHVIFGVMEAESVPDCKDINLVRSAFSRAASELQKQGITHMLVAETEHVKAFLLACGFREKDVKVFPYVAANLITDFSAVSEKKPDKIHVGYLGGSRPVRHPELIAEMIVSESIPDSVNLSVQFNLNYLKNKCGQTCCDKIIEMDKKGAIKLYSTNLSLEQYRSLFCSLDFVLLPYGERYHQIGSGIFFEAIYAGVIPVCAAGGKIHEVYTSLGGEPPCFETLSATAIRAAIMDGVERFAALKESTIHVRENWRQHPSSVEQWQSELADWLPDPHLAE